MATDQKSNPHHDAHPGDYGSDELEPNRPAREKRPDDGATPLAPKNGDMGSGGYGVASEGDPVG